jgi:hypothetical protein
MIITFKYADILFTCSVCLKNSKKSLVLRASYWLADDKTFSGVLVFVAILDNLTKQDQLSQHIQSQQWTAYIRADGSYDNVLV